eukprot:1316071-Pyramimonas_sp.AAC.1
MRMQGPRKAMSTLCGRGAASESDQAWAEGEGCKSGLGKLLIVTMRADCTMEEKALERTGT